MKVYTNTTFTGHYPVGTAAVVIARGPTDAAKALNAELVKIGLPGDALPKDMKVINCLKSRVTILRDGDY